MNTGILLVLMATVWIAGCSPNKLYRSELQQACNYSTYGDCAASAIQLGSAGTENEYHLGFIEYDDQGQLYDPNQQDRVIDNYLQIAGQQDVIVTVFIHGWQHSAKPEDTNVHEFRNLLRRISRLESDYSKQYGHPKRPVLGVYIGWRGNSIDVDYANLLTFWDRKSTAHKVGNQGVTEALLKLEELTNVRNSYQASSDSRLVVMGHSFGGAVLYGSIQKILTDRFISSYRHKTYQADAGGFGDLVVLLNPAFEALRYSTLFNLAQEQCRTYLPTQMPKLVTLTSETDDATGVAFPVGRVLSTFADTHRATEPHYCNPDSTQRLQPVTISEFGADIRTIGHFEPFLTHRIEPAGDKEEISFDLKDAYIDWSESDGSTPDPYSTVTLINKHRTTPRNPFMNIEVSQEIMDGHSDIWGDDILTFIEELIAVSLIPNSVRDSLLHSSPVTPPVPVPSVD